MTCTCKRICSGCGDMGGNHLHRPTLLGGDAGFDCKVTTCKTFTSADDYAKVARV